MRIFYSINQALHDLKRRWSFSLILMFCIAFSFLVLDTFLLITLNLRNVGRRLKEDVQIEVYLNEDVTPLQLHLLLQNIKRVPQVEKVEYRSKQKALAQLEKYLGEEFLRGLDYNPLPASFLLSLKREHREFEKVAEVASHVYKQPGVEDVEFGGVWLKNLDKISAIFFKVDILFGIIILAGIMVMISNFMRIVILSHAESIHIMSLMGADKSEVSRPFLLQGLLLGGGGALLGILFLWMGYIIFSNQIFTIRFLPFYMISSLIGWGMILGLGGSFFSVRKHLQIQS